VRLYDRLFMVEDPLAEKDKEFKDLINPESLVVRRRMQGGGVPR